MKSALPTAALTAMLLAGCVGSAPPPTAVVSPAPAGGASGRLDWERGHPERAAWSSTLRSEIGDRLDAFAPAILASGLCPAYAGLGAAQQADVVATLAVAVAKYESGYKPGQHYREPPPLGYDSIGLFQLSYEDKLSWCSMDSASRALEDPLNNIRCAVPLMARYAQDDRALAGGTSSRDARGFARYWSVLRDGPKHHRAAIEKTVRDLPACRQTTALR